MEHLAGRGITCPQPVKNRAGETLGRLAGRPAAMVTFLEGMWIRRPSAAHCAALGEALARLHLAGADFPMRARTRFRSPAGGSSTQPAAARQRGATRLWTVCSPASSQRSKANGRAACRRASSTPTFSPTTSSSSATSCPG